MSSVKCEYVPWIDLLRIVSCFMVLISHSCDPFVGPFDGSDSFVTGVFWGSLVRSCVPLFIMMSGILLFPVHTDLSTFYSKRIKRVVVPLVFWSIVLPLCFYAYLNLKSGSGNVLIDMENHSLQATFVKIYTAVFNFNHDTTPLWYIYMLIGVYLIIPIFGVWLQQASKKDMKVFLGLWGISLFIPYVKILAPLAGYIGNWGNMGVWGVSNWNEFGTFYYFSGFVGYIVLAYYLMKFPLNWSWKKTWVVAIPTFAVGYFITFLSFLTIQEYFPGEVATLELVWYFCNINVAMMTFALFIIFQKVKLKPSLWLKRVAGATFGIYLCHFIFVQMFIDAFLPQDLPTTVKILSIAVLGFGLSYLVTRLLESNKLTRRFVK